MEITRNEDLINRNAQIGKITSIASLLILGAGMFITFTQPEKVAWSLSALLLGFLLSQIGIYFTNRWGRNPRPDEEIDTALKGFGKNYHIFHYATPASHVLVGPAGVWVFVVKSVSGTIVFDKDKGRWKRKGGGLLSWYLKIFAQESIGRPDLEIPSERDGLQRILDENLPDADVAVQAALIFTHENVDIQVADAPAPTLHAKQLKDYLRKQAKKKPIASYEIEAVEDALQE